MKPNRKLCAQTGKLESLGHYEARVALAAEKRKPTDDDDAPLTVFPGHKITPTPGQLDVFGDEVR